MQNPIGRDLSTAGRLFWRLVPLRGAPFSNTRSSDLQVLWSFVQLAQQWDGVCVWIFNGHPLGSSSSLKTEVAGREAPFVCSPSTFSPPPPPAPSVLIRPSISLQAILAWNRFQSTQRYTAPGIILCVAGRKPFILPFLPRVLRENFKYYFGDFVRKGGTPPPLRTKFSPKKRLRIWGVPPLPPLRTFPRKMFFKKCLKMVFFAPKHLFLVPKKGYGYGGTSPPPLRKKICNVVFDLAPKVETGPRSGLWPVYTLWLAPCRRELEIFFWFFAENLLHTHPLTHPLTQRFQAALWMFDWKLLLCKKNIHNFAPDTFCIIDL